MADGICEGGAAVAWPCIHWKVRSVFTTMDPISDPSAAPCADRGVSPAQSRSIKRRLMHRVADADDSHVTIAAGGGEWQPFIDGVRIKVLHENEGMLSYLLRLEPGASLPPHRHPVDEECVVLEGSVQVGSRHLMGPGDFHLARRGALHATISTTTGATVFLRGAVPLAEHVLA